MSSGQTPYPNPGHANLQRWLVFTGVALGLVSILVAIAARWRSPFSTRVISRTSTAFPLLDDPPPLPPMYQPPARPASTKRPAPSSLIFIGFFIGCILLLLTLPREYASTLFMLLVGGSILVALGSAVYGQRGGIRQISLVLYQSLVGWFAASRVGLARWSAIGACSLMMVSAFLFRPPPAKPSCPTPSASC